MLRTVWRARTSIGIINQPMLFLILNNAINMPLVLFFYYIPNDFLSIRIKTAMSLHCVINCLYCRLGLDIRRYPFRIIVNLSLLP